MTQPAVAPDIHQALDVHGDLTPEIALHPHLFVDNLADAVDLVVCQVTHARVGIDVGALEELLTSMQSNAIDIWQSRLDPLVARKINSRNSRHAVSPFRPLSRGRLALPLLVPWVDANHPDNAVAPDNLALLAAARYRCGYFHHCFLFYAP